MAVGEFEALTALAGYAFEHPATLSCRSSQIAGPLFDAKELDASAAARREGGS